MIRVQGAPPPHHYGRPDCKRHDLSANMSESDFDFRFCGERQMNVLRQRSEMPSERMHVVMS